MKTIHIILISFMLYASLFTVKAYRIEISVATAANMPVFLAGYYGDRTSVIDSAMMDASGAAVFEQKYDLCTGMYTVIAPGKLIYDLLIDSGQQLQIFSDQHGKISVNGDAQTATFAEYQEWNKAGNDKLVSQNYRSQIINNYPGTFLAAYLTALQPVESQETGINENMNNLMQIYHYRRRHFFDNMPLSDIRLMRTPLYHETVQYYVTKFVTQQTDSLIHIAYRMLEQAAGNCETFFYISDYLTDFSMRSKLQDISKLYNFVQRNRDMLGTKGKSMLPARISTNYFTLNDGDILANRLRNMFFTGTDGKMFDANAHGNGYRVFYFWKNDCQRCIANAARLQTVLHRYADKCTGIAVNIAGDVTDEMNRILTFEPLCTNVSCVGAPQCETVFFADMYSKIILTDADGTIVGLFGSTASLDNFMRIAR